VLLFAAMAYLSAAPDASVIAMLAVLAALQISETKLEYLESVPGKVLWIVLKLAVAYLLIGYTRGLASQYYLILLLPVVSAASSPRVFSTLLFTLVACASYLSFYLWVDTSRYELGPEEWRQVAWRVVYIVMAGNLASVLAELVRVQSGNYREIAERLAEANRSLQAAEAAVRRADRLAALGQLSAGLAHELRNPLGTIKASAEMLERGVAKENEIAREVSGFITSEVDRANSLVTRFLEFARPLKLKSAVEDITATLNRTIAVLERDPGARHVAVIRNYAPDVPPFSFDSELMERVFYNLLLNAAQATAPGGEITVKTRRVDSLAEISVIDRGSGIDPKLLDTIFNPFFTTKPEGVGMGLSIVSRIVDEHGGRIAVESEPGKGSIFRVLLPTRSAQ